MMTVNFKCLNVECIECQFGKYVPSGELALICGLPNTFYMTFD